MIPKLEVSIVDVHGSPFGPSKIAVLFPIVSIFVSSTMTFVPSSAPQTFAALVPVMPIVVKSKNVELNFKNDFFIVVFLFYDLFVLN